MRILHLADVHLDTAFLSRDEGLRKKLRAATRSAFRGAVDLALSEGVDAVVMAGDLFDSHRLSFQSEQFLLTELDRLLSAGITTVYCTGNHDPGSLSTARRAISWPKGLRVVADAEPVIIEVKNADGQKVGTITTAGHETDEEERDLASTFPPPTGDLPRVAVLHAQVDRSRTAASHGRYAPCGLGTLQESGFDYWALGHIHQREVLSELPGVCYPGNLQGRSPRETGAKGVVLVDVERGLPPTIDFRPLASIRWETLEVTDPEAASPRELVREVMDLWNAARSSDPYGAADWLVRLVISGTTPLWSELQKDEEVEWLADELAGRMDAIHVDVRVGQLTAPVDVSMHEEREDALGEAIRLVRALASGDLSTGLDRTGLAKGLRGPPTNVSLEDYLAEILAEAPEELVSRLHVPEDDGGAAPEGASG